MFGESTETNVYKVACCNYGVSLKADMMMG